MRVNLKKETYIMPMPVLIIGTYDENNVPNAMNAAWGGAYDFNKIFISLSEHKTTKNLEIKKAFTVSFATKETLVESDYFGIVSGNKVNKIEKANFHVSKASKVDAPIFSEYPLTLECEVDSFDGGNLIGNIVNVSVDDKYIKDGKIDIDNMHLISYDPTSHTYREIGGVVGHAFKDGLKLK